MLLFGCLLSGPRETCVYVVTWRILLKNLKFGRDWVPWTRCLIRIVVRSSLKGQRSASVEATQAAKAGRLCGFGRSFASFRRFWAVAARRNSSLARFGPRSLSLPILRMRLRWAKCYAHHFWLTRHGRSDGAAASRPCEHWRVRFEAVQQNKSEHSGTSKCAPQLHAGTAHLMHSPSI
jgi:hypothetical protein